MHSIPTTSIIKRLIPSLTLTLLTLLTLPGHATVITSGCTSATSCTLAELYAGGTITINDVLFNHWVFNFADGDPLDENNIIISGIDETTSPTPGLSTVGLGVVLDPTLLAEFAEYDFDFTGSIIGTTRLFTGSSLQLIGSNVSGDGFVEINNALSTGHLLSVDADGATTSTVNFPGVASLISDTDIQMESFDGQSVSLREYRYTFNITGNTIAVPEPATVFLFIISLLAIVCTRRRRPAL